MSIFSACSCPSFCTPQDQKQHPRALDVSAENSILCVLAFARPDFLTSVISAGDFAPQANSIPREQEVAVWTSRDFPCHQITVCESENKLVQATPSRLSTKEAHCLISDVQRDFEIFVLPSHFFKDNTVKSTIHSRGKYTASPVYSHSEEYQCFSPCFLWNSHYLSVIPKTNQRMHLLYSLSTPQFPFSTNEVVARIHGGNGVAGNTCST